MKKIKRRVLFLLAGFLSAAPAGAHAPHDVIRTLAISPDYSRDQTLFHVNAYAFREKILMRSTDGAKSWKHLVKGLTGSAPFVFVETSPGYASDRTVYLATQGNGIFRSTDGGSSWSPASDGLAKSEISLVKASSGPVLAAGRRGGLFRSDDGSGRWELALPLEERVTWISFAPGSTTTAWIGDDQGVLRLSSDGGRSWTELARFPAAGAINCIEFSKTFSSDGSAFVGTEKAGLLKTRDGGRTFAPVSQSVPDLNVTSIAISPEFAKDRTVFFCTWTQGVFRSLDGGAIWKRTNRGIYSDKQADLPGYNESHCKWLRISDGYAKDRTIFMGGFGGLFKSTDGGDSWSEFETLWAKAIYSLSISPGFARDGTLAITTHYNGAFLSRDRGASWKHIEQVAGGLRENHAIGSAFSPDYARDRTLFAFSNQAIYESPDGGETWKRNRLWKPLIDTSPFPVAIALSPRFSADSTLFLGTRYSGVFRSTDRGETWKSSLLIGTGSVRMAVDSLAAARFGKENAVFAVSRNDGKAYASFDGGERWKMIYGGGKQKAFRVSAAPGASGKRTVFLGTTGGLLRSVDGGGSWSPAPVSGSSDNIEAVAVSPYFKNDGLVLVSVKGSGLFRSTDGGRTFSEAARELVDSQHTLRLIQFSPDFARDRTVYGASQEELFLSKDGGLSWSLIERPERLDIPTEVTRNRIDLDAPEARP